LYAVAWTAVNSLGWEAKNASTTMIIPSASTPSPHQPCGGTAKRDAQFYLAFTGYKFYLGRRYASRTDTRESYLVMGVKRLIAKHAILILPPAKEIVAWAERKMLTEFGHL
jgi:hypothetical protein